LEVTEVVRKEWPEEKPLFVRISATDWTEGGWTVEDSVKLSIKLKELGVDLIDTSSGGNVPKATIPSKPSYQVPFAAQIKKEANILTGAVGQITTAKQSEEILKEGKADLILYARESLRQPYFALHAAKELNVDVEWPLQYQRAKI
jgi:2,4-dienoyl-CoA reductase-like NADH-dependent reductase (Old Yellow Enzyme family)